jgi:hypothetical protein
MRARIGSPIAVQAARNLAERGWRTPQKLADSTWQLRVSALHDAGYTRYQERTATMLGDLTDSCSSAGTATCAARARRPTAALAPSGGR